MSVYTATDTISSGDLFQAEVDLYGSSRLGIWKPYLNMTHPADTQWVDMPGLSTRGYFITFNRGNKLFELTNHTGNVLVTVSDKKRPRSADGSTIDYYDADVISATDYYPFGMQMPGRSYWAPASAGAGNEGNTDLAPASAGAQSQYRYGFNGKEKDKDIQGGTDYDYGFRIYNPLLGRFLSVDPLTEQYAYLTPYQFSSNSPITFTDMDGLESVYITRTHITPMIQQPDGTWVKGQTYTVTTTRTMGRNWLGQQKHGHLGTGTLVVDVAKTTYVAQPKKQSILSWGGGATPPPSDYFNIMSLKAIYILSPEDEEERKERLEREGRKLPISTHTAQVMVFGNGDNSYDEEASEAANPNEKVLSIDLGENSEASDILGLVFAAFDNQAEKHYKLDADEILTSIQEQVIKTEDKAEKKEGVPNPNVGYCEACHAKFKLDKDGNLTRDSAGVQDQIPIDTTTSHGEKPNRQTKVR